VSFGAVVAAVIGNVLVGKMAVVAVVVVAAATEEAMAEAVIYLIARL
jgi:hypothetical protein